MGSMPFGKYRLIAELGHGGMADVFLALQAGPAGSGFRKLTVIKRLRRDLVEEPEFVAMLVDEARIAARLNHPNVVQTNEVGNVGNQYFIAMEYLDGQPLHRIQHRIAKRLAAGEAVVFRPEHQYVILMDALAGLHHAHELADYNGGPLDIIHRDMTPQNVFLTYEGQVKVVDFGIAKAAGRSSETRHGEVKGKIRYMAPEQAVGLNVTRQADLFAVGIMLWEAAVGARMWKEKDDSQIIQRLLSGTPLPPPSTVRPDVSPAIDAICQKALALSPRDRYQTAEAFRSELEHYLTDSGQLLVLRRQLGPSLSELFADKRKELRDVIERQLSTIDDAPPSGSVVSLYAGPASKTSMSMTSSTLPSNLKLAEPEPAPPTPLAAHPPSPRKRRPIVLAASVAAIVLAAVLVYRVAPSYRSTATHPLDKTEEEQIAVHLRGTPESARASIDDGPFQPLPLDTKVMKDARPHHIRIEADGYEPRIEPVSFASDVTVHVDLVKPPQPPQRAASAAHASSAAPAAKPVAHPPVVWRPPISKKEAPKTEPVSPPAHPAPRPSPEPAPSAGMKHIPLDKGDPWGGK